MIPTVDPLPETVVLQLGQALRTAVEAGSWLHLVEGRAQLLSPPSWFGDSVYTARAVLDEGEVHRLERGGWIELTALTPVRLRIRLPYAAHLPAVPEDQTRPVMRLMRLLTGW
jgi:hypothetical protein